MPMGNHKKPWDDGPVWLPLVAEHLFAANLRLERESRGMTQAALARQMTLREVPLSQSAIAKLEREDDDARRPIRLVEAAALAEFFEKSIDDMTRMLVPESDEHRRLIEALNARSRALGDLVAARQALAEAEESAEKAVAAVKDAEAAMVASREPH